MALAIEFELVEYYGRRDIGTDILTNLCDGGRKSTKMVYSEETRAKMRESQRLKVARGDITRHSEEYKAKLRERYADGISGSIPILQIGMDGVVIKEWKSAAAAAKYFKLRQRGSFVKASREGSHHTCCNFFWRKADSIEVIDGILITHEELRNKIAEPANARKINQLSLSGEFIKTWRSVTQAAEAMGVKQATLWASEKHKRICAGFLWEKV